MLLFTLALLAADPADLHTDATVVAAATAVAPGAPSMAPPAAGAPVPHATPPAHVDAPPADASFTGHLGAGVGSAAGIVAGIPVGTIGAGISGYIGVVALFSGGNGATALGVGALLAMPVVFAIPVVLGSVGGAAAGELVTGHDFGASLIGGAAGGGAALATLVVVSVGGFALAGAMQNSGASPVVGTAGVVVGLAAAVVAGGATTMAVTSLVAGE